MKSGGTSEPLFLLDENLNPRVAEALRCVGYHVTTIEASFGSTAIDDPDIISWCKANSAVWVTSDIKARKRFHKELLTSSIYCLWVYRKQGAMSSKEQLRVLSYVLSDLVNRLNVHPKHLHYRARVHGLPPNERIVLEEISVDELAA